MHLEEIFGTVGSGDRTINCSIGEGPNVAQTLSGAIVVGWPVSSLLHGHVGTGPRLSMPSKLG